MSTQIEYTHTDPALLLPDEYAERHRLAQAGERIVDTALTLDELNVTREKPQDWPTLVRRIKVGQLNFELRVRSQKLRWVRTDRKGQSIRLKGATQTYTDEEIQRLGLPLHRHDMAVFEEGRKVAAAVISPRSINMQIAEEYKAFGLDAVVGHTAAALRNGEAADGPPPTALELHRHFVGQSLRNGYYTSLVSQGLMTLERVHDILSSLSEPEALTDAKPDSRDDVAQWLLYVGEYGDFVLYSRALREALRDEDPAGIIGMIKGMIYVSETKTAYIRGFGGTTGEVKRLLMSCAIDFTRRRSGVLLVAEEELGFVDSSLGVISDELDWSAGFRARRVTATGRKLDYDSLGAKEREFRQSFDSHGEFKGRLLRLAYRRFRVPDPPTLAAPVAARAKETAATA